MLVISQLVLKAEDCLLGTIIFRKISGYYHTALHNVSRSNGRILIMTALLTNYISVVLRCR